MTTETLTKTIFDASRTGDATAIRIYAPRLQDIDVRDDKGFTPLIIAAYNGYLRATETLLDAGADVNAQDLGGNTALMGVCFKGNKELAELLISRGADLNIQHSSGGTALIFATMFSHNTLIELLLHHGADTTIRDARGLTAPILAEQQENAEAVALFSSLSITGNGVKNK